MKTDNTKTTNSKTADNGYKTTSNGKTTGSGQRTAGTTRSTTEGEFHNFFVEQLKDIYWAEKHLKKGLKKMSRAPRAPSCAMPSRNTTTKATSRSPSWKRSSD